MSIPASRRSAASRAAMRNLLPHIYLALAAVAALFAASVYIRLVSVAIDNTGGAIDVRLMQELGRRWIDTGSMYLPSQLTGPFDAGSTPLPGLYPPACGPLFALLALIPTNLLTVAWITVPCVVLAAAIWRWRPARWSWAIVLLFIGWPTSAVVVVNAGTTLWIAAGVAAALGGARWAASLILLKPTFAPFALIGIRSRAWWGLCAAIAALTLAGPWRDYVTVLANVRGADYQLWSLPIVLAPLVAWAARSRRDGSPADRRGQRAL